MQLPQTLCPYFSSLDWKHRPQFSQIWLPSTCNATLIDTKFGKVPKGSLLSYQLASSHVANGDIILNEDVTLAAPFALPDLSSNLQGFLPLARDIQMKYNSLFVTEEQSIEFERITRDQSDSAEWKKLRQSRITASNFKRVCSRRGNFESLSAEMHKVHHVQTAAMKYGIETEPLAAEQYAQTFGRNVYKVGFVVNPSCFYLGCSPDRRVFDQDDVNNPWGLLEIKCSKSESVTLIDYLQSKRDGSQTMKLKKTHAYYYQVMGQMGLSGSSWCDFFVRTQTDYHCERIEFDEIFCRDMMDKLTLFFSSILFITRPG